MKSGLVGGAANPLAILVLSVALTSGGCGEKSGTDGKGASGAGNPITAPVDYLGAVGAAQKQAQRVADLTPVQQAVQAFQAGEDRLPSTLQELVSEGYLARLPAPPRGAQLAYNPTTGQVKFVPAPAPASAGTTPPPGR